LREALLLRESFQTFTNWLNALLAKKRMKVDDLFVDLSSGIVLLHLAETAFNCRIEK
jgi:hypothetical protein